MAPRASIDSRVERNAAIRRKQPVTRRGIGVERLTRAERTSFLPRTPSRARKRETMLRRASAGSVSALTVVTGVVAALPLFLPYGGTGALTLAAVQLGHLGHL